MAKIQKFQKKKEKNRPFLGFRWEFLKMWIYPSESTKSVDTLTNLPDLGGWIRLQDIFF